MLYIIIPCTVRSMQGGKVGRRKKNRENKRLYNSHRKHTNGENRRGSGFVIFGRDCGTAEITMKGVRAGLSDRRSFIWGITVEREEPTSPTHIHTYTTR